jgi:tetratricopeptide (TPR) repeat protein
MNLHEEALKHFEAALRLEESATTHNNIGTILVAQKRFPDARPHFEAALRFDRDTINSHLGLAVILVDEGRLDEALRHYDEMLRIEPGNLTAMEEKAKIMDRQGKWMDAESAYRYLLELKPDTTSARFNLALLLQNRGQTAEAIDQYGRVLKSKPSDADTVNNLGWILSTHPEAPYRDGARALALIAPLTEGTTPDSNLLDTLAAALAESGRFEDAVRAIRRAIGQARIEKKTDEFIRELETRATLYSSGQPYRDPKLNPGP